MLMGRQVRTQLHLPAWPAPSSCSLWCLRTATWEGPLSYGLGALMSPGRAEALWAGLGGESPSTCEHSLLQAVVLTLVVLRSPC